MRARGGPALKNLDYLGVAINELGPGDGVALADQTAPLLQTRRYSLEYSSIRVN